MKVIGGTRNETVGREFSIVESRSLDAKVSTARSSGDYYRTMAQRSGRTLAHHSRRVATAGNYSNSGTAVQE